MFHFKKNHISSAAPEYVIAGLGNPGTKYELTRHNVGFLFLDCLAQQQNCKVSKLKFQSLYADTNLAGHRCLLVKPQTFMNHSGRAIGEIASFYKIPPERIIVVFDDISLQPGQMRIRRKGTDGGHNGIKSIIYHLSSDQFPRIKIGVGGKPHPDYDLADWVLSNISSNDQQQIAQAIDNACKAVNLMVDDQIDQAMNLYNC